MGATAMDLPRFDTWHYDTPALTVIGSRLANAIKYHLGQSAHYRGPSISLASFSAGNRDQVIVTITHQGGTDITPATGITGFEVFDNGSSVAIQSAVRDAADAVRLTLSRSILPGHSVTLRYLYGVSPNVSGVVKDNSQLALPLENTAASIAVSSVNQAPICSAVTLTTNEDTLEPLCPPAPTPTVTRLPTASWPSRATAPPRWPPASSATTRPRTSAGATPSPTRHSTVRPTRPPPWST